MTVAVLCARRDSVYHDLGVDVYDADRDARTFPLRSGVPVVCHPPCRGWGRFRWRSNHDESELDLARFCVQACRANGGVLEHPEGSALWADQGLPRPLSIDQSWWGHPAPKRTWLFIFPEVRVPSFPIRLGSGTGRVTDLSRADRERTPPAFAEWLIELARICGEQHGLRGL